MNDQYQLYHHGPDTAGHKFRQAHDDGTDVAGVAKDQVCGMTVDPAAPKHRASMACRCSSSAPPATEPSSRPARRAT